MMCHFHPGKTACATDSIVDLENSTQFNTAYKRVPICYPCAVERGKQNTSRIEWLSGEWNPAANTFTEIE